MESSDIADHCVTHGLSSSKEPCYAGKCNHEHNKSCSSCEKLKIVLKTVEDAVNSDDNQQSEYSDDVKFTFKQALQSIQAWKAHPLRSIQQDKSRILMLEELAPDHIFITQDWAMKFLPQKYRETQADWFGKRGVSWHISVAVRKSPSGSLQHQTFVHVVKNCSQDSDAVIPIMEHTLRTLKMENPEITTAFYRGNNAGCYHSVAMLAACHLMEETTGIKVRQVDFSDPQDGKRSCDRMAATIKAHVRIYINEGHDVQTASDLRNTIISNGGVRGVRVTLVDGSTLSSFEVGKLDGISTLNNFRLGENGITCWKAYAVGQGKTIAWSHFQVSKALAIVPFQCPFSGGTFVDIKSSPIARVSKTVVEDEKSENDDEEVDEVEDSDPKLFSCPVEGCIRSYQRYRWLENHLHYGQCSLREEKESLFDKAKISYSQKLTVGNASQPVLPVVTSKYADQTVTLQQGWALKASKKSRRFSEKQKVYLNEVFSRGKETGHKMDPAIVAQEMRLDFAGNRRFQIDEFLSSSQTKGYFARKASKDRHNIDEEEDQDRDEEAAAEEQAAYSQTCSVILDECHLTHPLVYESIDLCRLYATQKMDKLSISNLKMVCEFLGLDTSEISSRPRKAPYIHLISNVIKTCSCAE